MIQNINVKNDENIQHISVMSKSALLLKKELDKNNSNNPIELDDKSKALLEKGLNSEYKETKNNILSIYKNISNLAKKDMEKPLEVINENLKYNMNTSESKESIKVLDHFIQKEESLELNQELKTNLIENLSQNDFCKENTEESLTEKKKSFFNEIKEGVIKGVNKKMKNGNIFLTDKQKENLEIAQKSVNIIKHVCATKEGLSQKDLENIGNLVKKSNDKNNSKEFNNFIKNEAINIVEISLQKKDKQTIPENLMNELSKEIQGNKQKNVLNILNKVSENQALTKDASNNLIKLLNDDSIYNINDTNDSSNKENEDEKYNISYQILSKQQENLDEHQKNVFEIAKNTKNLSDNQNNNNEIIKSINNINNIVEKGYHVNKHTEKQIQKIFDTKGDNDKIIESTTNLINTMAENGVKVNSTISNKIIDKISKGENISKNSMKKLTASLINIISKCDVPKESINAFGSILKKYKDKKNFDEIELAITGLNILSKMHYVMNQESIDISLDIISKNEFNDKTLDVLSETLSNIFLEADINDNTFNKLFYILNNNKKLYNNLSICLYNTLKYKKQDQIDKLIKDNLNNLENAVNEGFFNENILNILNKTSQNIISEKKILKKCLEFDALCSKLDNTLDLKEKVSITKKLYNYKPYKNYTSKHFTIIQNNICGENSIKILKELLEKDFDLLQNEINIEKIFNSYKYNLSDVLDIIKLYYSHEKDINNDILFQLLKIIVNEDKNLCDKIINIYESIQKIRNVPDIIEFQIKLEKEDSLDIEIINHMLYILNDSDSVPERYIEKIFKNYEDNKKKESLSKLVIYLINKKIKLPDKLIDEFCSSISDEKIIELIPKFLSNENISDNYKNIFSNKLENYLKNNTDSNQKQKIIDKFVLYCKFSQLLSSLQKSIISSINDFCKDKTDYGSYLYWFFDNQSGEKKELNKLIFSQIKESKFKSDYEQLIQLKNDKERRDALLNENIVIDKLLKELSGNDNELNQKIDGFISSICSNNNIKKNNILIISLVESFINQKENYDLSKEDLLLCLGKYLQIEFDINEILKKIKNQSCIKYIRKIWILKLLNKKKIENLYINGLNIQEFIYNKLIEFTFCDELIEKFIKMIDINFYQFGNNIQNFFEFIKENISLLDQLKSAISEIKEISSFQNLINQIKNLYIIKNCHDKNKINFCKIFILNNWKLFNIKKFIDAEIDLEPKGNEELIKEIQNVILINKLSFESKAKKGHIYEGKNIIDIFAKCPRKDWELAIKNLCIIQKLGDKQQNDIDSLIEELKERNSDIENSYLDKLKEYIQRIRKAYNCPIECVSYEENISKDKISNFDKNDIIKWSKSKRTKDLIKNDESFLIEALAVINGAYHIDTQSKCDGGYDIRDVQLLSVLTMLLKPKNKGRFCQINTGEGKSSIVSILGTIKALQYKYVDILSSSIVLAKRDAEEKTNFYSLFGLSVSSTDDEDCYNSNIVYGDSLGFEGDTLREIFNNGGKRLKNKERGFVIMIVDEVDSLYIDNLSASTRLCAPFPSYSFLTILYPWIYNNLNVIDNLIEKKQFADFREENREKFTVNKLKEIVRHLIKENEEGFQLENERINIIVPKNLKEFIELQIDGWCESAFQAKHYFKENYHYVIAKEKDEGMDNLLKENGFIPRHNYLISPVDYANTGVVSLHMQWNNALSQMLQIKHGLKITTEDLTTTYLSHYNFLRKYVHKDENNIFGVTGTLGNKESQSLLSTLFNIEVCIIPPFKPSRYISLLAKTGFTKREEWKEAIMKDIELNVERQRVVLVICYTIEEADELYDNLKSRKYDENKMLKYQRNDIQNDDISRKHDAGEVIFATNLAGRGTDISLTDLVEKNGGMHVIVTFLPSNERVEQQAVGRTARSGKNGSGNLIVNEQRSIKELKRIRDYREDQRIINIKNNEIKNIKLMGDLFNKFISVYKDISNKVGDDLEQPD